MVSINCMLKTGSGKCTKRAEVSRRTSVALLRITGHVCRWASAHRQTVGLANWEEEPTNRTTDGQTCRRLGDSRWVERCTNRMDDDERTKVQMDTARGGKTDSQTKEQTGRWTDKWVLYSLQNMPKVASTVRANERQAYNWVRGRMDELFEQHEAEEEGHLRRLERAKRDISRIKEQARKWHVFG
ncbi:unnamed protein product [Protopolystoma xenopodis]|uniref:Uncharacterized protein n=1 Tax=Protopolystoma xenopodis TaxID=117903 RepID=A0A3S5CPY7_9PLAT|nr:unnamed protein product [Protopolystoma xenopodis]